MINTTPQRIANTFKTLQDQHRKAIIPFITTGDPKGVAIDELMRALVTGGADMIELGIPFSDPSADGETIQRASARAIANGISYHDSFAAIAAFRKSNQHTPVIVFGYLNPAQTHTDGFHGFATALKAAGGDALILVDLSYESGAPYRQVLKDKQINLINLISPTTATERLGHIVKVASGFIYYVSMRGVTGNTNGKNHLNHREIQQAVEKIRIETQLPVCVGFGITNGETAKTIAKLADGIVVGSALVKKLYNAAHNNDNVLTTAKAFMAELRQALDN